LHRNDHRRLQADADEAFELWKIRELKRIKRDREEREKLVPVRLLPRVHHVTLCVPDPR
jgi:hypothetical protein